ncbi:tetratricopeptide repeat-containing sensor histidine kinase [Mucilaginibacter celer]|uniref:histidine kinase n=1 Tax=Mucilaginibacter celer TaxID=2305508 RepID=A0A494VJA1_9SPHI|nr:sensor histidine kinase [Mucilaginibacter celer]AYL94344.1 hypothetical protein HYN43_003100 [Mucilaginibacter celer]
MVRVWLISFIFIICSASAYPQNHAGENVARLRDEISRSKPDTDRIKLQYKIADYFIDKKGYFQIDRDSSIAVLNQALALSRALHSVSLENETLLRIGNCHLHVDDVEQGSRFYLMVIGYYQDTHNPDLEARTWERLGDALNRGPKTIDKKIENYQHARMVYERAHERLKAILVFKKIADMHMVQGNYDLAESELKTVVRQLRSVGFKNLHFTYDLLASLSKLKGNFHKELFYKTEVISSMEATGDYSYASYFYFNIAMTYFDLGLYAKSRVFFNKALAFSLKEKNYNRYFEALASVVKTLLAEGENTDALTFLTDKTQFMPPANDTQRQWMDTAFGNCYEKMGDITKAEFYYRDLIRLSDVDLKNQDFEDYLRNYNTVSNFYVGIGRYKDAGLYLDKLLGIPVTLIRPSAMRQIQLLQFKVDSASGKWVAAIRHYQLHKKINDSLYNATNKKLLEEVAIRNESERKDRNLELQSKNIQLLQKQSQLEQNQVDKAKAIKNVVLAGFVMVSVLLALVYNRYRLKQRSNLQMQEKQRIISEKNTALEKLLRDNEWLTREAHHRVKNNMQMIVSLLSSQSLYLKDGAAYDAVADSRHRIQTMSLIHQKLYRADNMSTVPMRGYINELIDYLKEFYKAKHAVGFIVRVDPIELDVVQAIPVGLLLNEAVTNAFKHAFPHQGQDKLTVSLEHIQADELLLIINDNGKGLPVGFDSDQTNSFGIKLMKGLAEELNGKLSISEDHGTTIAVSFKRIQLRNFAMEDNDDTESL